MKLTTSNFLTTGLAAVATLLAGCLANPPVPAPLETIAAVAPATAPATAPAASEAAPVVPPKAEERFSVDVANAPARPFFMGLVEGTRQNLMVHPEVSGLVTVQLKDVTLVEALQAMRDMYGYDFRRSGAGYVILPASVQTRLFKLDYLDLMRSGSSRTRVSSGQISESKSNSSAMMSGIADANPDTGGRDNGPSESSEVTGSNIYTSYKTDFWAQLEQNLRSLVGMGIQGKEDRSVVINAQAGVIAVHAAPSELRSVEDYLRSIQSTITRQVVLEARIVEVELSDGYQAGINWAMVIQKGNRTYTTGQTGPSGFDGNLLANGIQDSVNVAPGNPITGFTNTTLGGAFTLALDLTDFNAFIELLKTQGDTRVLSSPRVSTLHNQKAVIKAGSDEFFVTDISSNTVTGTSSATNRDVELTPFFSGIALDVTPQISSDGMVILHVHPTVSEVTDQVKALTVAGVTDQIPLAFSEIRESDSIVKARSGQLIVIGGLMRDTRTKKNFSTPFLGDVPVLGQLFKSRQDTVRKTELVILLRPIVIDNDSQWDDMTSEPGNLRTAQRKP